MKIENGNQVSKKGIGCIVVLAILVIGFIALFIAFKLTYVPSPMNKWFEDNKLGYPDIEKEDTWTKGKTLNVEADGIPYKVYITGENEDIYKIFLGNTNIYAIYNIEENDISLDDAEKNTIKNAKYFWDSNKKDNKIKILNDDIKKTLNFPDTFKHIETSYFDQGIEFIINIKFQAKNAFGVPSTSVAKYKYDLTTGKYSFIETN